MREISLRALALETLNEISSPLLRKRAGMALKITYTSCYRVFSDSTEVGFVALGEFPCEDYMVLREIIVEPSLRRRGIGTEILAAVERLILDLGRTRIVIDPEPFMGDVSRDVLVQWYTDQGYRHRKGTKKEMEKRLERPDRLKPDSECSR